MMKLGRKIIRSSGPRGLNPAAVRENVAAYLFLAPLLVNFVIFVAIPIVFSLILCFVEWEAVGGMGLINMEFVGLDNLRKVLADPWFKPSLINTVVFAAFTVPTVVVLGLVIAALLSRYVRFKRLIKTSLFIPYISSIVASAIVWQTIFHPSYGPITLLLQSLGIEQTPYWFADARWALPLVIIFSIWREIGYVVLVYTAGIEAVSEELYEAASIDGATGIQQFFNITVPLVKPTTIFLVTIQLIGSFKVFDVIEVLTQGGPGTSTSVMAYYIYRSAFRYFEMSSASVAAWIVFIIVFAITRTRGLMERRASR